MNLSTADTFGAIGAILGCAVLTGALVLYRRQPRFLMAALAWLALAITIGSVKRFVTASGTVPWVILLGIEVACLAIALWRLGRHTRTTAPSGHT